MKLTPRSTARRSTATAPSWSSGGPQMPSPVMRIAPKPRRRTFTSPPRPTVPAAAASVASIVTARKVPAAPSPETQRSGALLIREREPHVHAGDGHELALLGRLAVERGELGVDEWDEVQVAGIQVVREPAPVPLSGQRQVPDRSEEH